MELDQVLADPQSQARSAAALQIVAIELCELVEHLGLILERYSYIQEEKYLIILRKIFKHMKLIHRHTKRIYQVQSHDMFRQYIECRR
jgi:hypothetical protein